MDKQKKLLLHIHRFDVKVIMQNGIPHIITDEVNMIITDDMNFEHSGFTQWVVHVHVAGTCTC